MKFKEILILKKKDMVITSILLVILVVIAVFVFWKNDEDTKVSNEIVKIEAVSAKEVKDQYNKLKIGNTLDNINKTLGDPVYTEFFNDNYGNNNIIYTWGSSRIDEIGARLSVSVEDNKVLEKSVSGLYVAYDSKKLMTAEKFEKIEVDKEITSEDLIKDYGEPNSMAEYKNADGKTIQTVTWTTNTSGSIGAYYTVVFTNNIATSKSEVGLT